LGVVVALELEDFRAVGLARLVRVAGLAELARVAGLAELARLVAFAGPFPFAWPFRLVPELARRDPFELAPLRRARVDAARLLPEAFFVVAGSAMTLLGG
jgi:hypothetical protein